MSVTSTNAPKRSRLSAALIAALVVPFVGSAFAQDATSTTNTDTGDSEQSTATLDKVTVTGSRIKRAEVEGPAPVTVITAAEIEREGFATVYDALNSLTQNTASIQNELNQNGFTPNASFLNLRGLGPGYQLILINGRRAADYPLPYNSQSNAVNLANIPAAALERVEVLTGGASAIYGSDAVAGVVNLIMKTNYEGDQLSVRAGTTTQGGGDSGRFQWIGGKTGDNWSVVYAFEAVEREAIFASQRKFMDSYFDEPGVDPEDVNAVEGLLVFDIANSNRVFPDGGEATCARFSEFDAYYFETSSVYTGPRCGYFGYPATQAIRNSDSNQSGYLYGTFDFDNGLQGWAQLSASRSKATFASATQFWSSSDFFDPNLESDFTGPGGGAFVNLQRIFTPAEVGGASAQNATSDERAFDVAFGLRGTMLSDRFDWDATVSRAEYRIETRRPRFLANRLTEYFLGEQQGFDPYFDAYPVYELNQARFFNPIDAATFQSLNTTLVGKAESDVTQANFTVSGDLFELPAGAFGAAAVIEAARQSYELTPDPRTLPGYTGNEPIYNYSDTGGGGERDRYALGLEFSIPILDSLKASVAGRYDKYDDVTNVDDAVTWQVGLEWRPVDSLLFRGSHGTSFRAPDMHYVYAGESGFFTSIVDEYRCRRDGLNPQGTACSSDADYNYQVQGIRRGSTDLEEEEGKSTTFGVVWDITDQMSVSADWYDIELTGGVDDIFTSYLFREEASCLLGTDRAGNSVDQNSAACQFFTGLVTRTDSPFRDNQVDEYRSFPVNQSLSRTSGIDVNFKYGLDTDRLGDFDLELAWTHVLKKEIELFPGDGIIDDRDDLVNQRTLNFRSRFNWSASWQLDDWAANVNGYRLGSLPLGDSEGRGGSFVIWNAGVSKEITEKATVSFQVQNLLDKKPLFDEDLAYPFFWSTYYSGVIGREVFLQFSYKLR